MDRPATHISKSSSSVNQYCHNCISRYLFSVFYLSLVLHRVPVRQQKGTVMYSKLQSVLPCLFFFKCLGYHGFISLLWSFGYIYIYREMRNEWLIMSAWLLKCIIEITHWSFFLVKKHLVVCSGDGQMLYVVVSCLTHQCGFSSTKVSHRFSSVCWCLRTKCASC